MGSFTESQAQSDRWPAVLEPQLLPEIPHITIKEPIEPVEGFMNVLGYVVTFSLFQNAGILQGKMER